MSAARGGLRDPKCTFAVNSESRDGRSSRFSFDLSTTRTGPGRLSCATDVRDQPVTGRAADMTKSTRMTHLRQWAALKKVHDLT